MRDPNEEESELIEELEGYFPEFLEELMTNLGRNDPAGIRYIAGELGIDADVFVQELEQGVTLRTVLTVLQVTGLHPNDVIRYGRGHGTTEFIDRTGGVARLAAPGSAIDLEGLFQGLGPGTG